MAYTFGQDPVLADISHLLAEIGSGRPVEETQRVDLKEERGRRDKSGAVGPSNPRNEAAAQHLAAEAACMANTEGGGAIICGVSDDGTPIGTSLEVEWLRHRIYQLTGVPLRRG